MTLKTKTIPLLTEEEAMAFATTIKVLSDICDQVPTCRQCPMFYHCGMLEDVGMSPSKFLKSIVHTMQVEIKEDDENA